jgi:hypothetical protein
MNIERDRVISICLTEAEWQAFVARHPKPVDWLRERILLDLGDGTIGQRERAAPAAGFRSGPLN